LGEGVMDKGKPQRGYSLLKGPKQAEKFIFLTEKI
jgi:hypothetical protein